MATLTTMVEGARVTATTPHIFTRSLMRVSAVDRNGTALGEWLLPSRHWMEEVAPLIVAARREQLARVAAMTSPEGRAKWVHP